MQSDRRLTVIALAIASLLAIGAGLVLRELPPLIGIELKLYDAAAKSRALPMDPDSRVVMIAYTEDFLSGTKIAGETWPHPVHDDKLASILGRLLDADAAAIGIDIWRGIPQPEGSDDETLDTLLAEHERRERILWIHDPSSDRQLYAPPEGLAGDPMRAVLPGFVRDDGHSGLYHRGFYLESVGDGVAFSLGMAAAELYLLNEGIGVEWGEDPAGPHQFNEATLSGFASSDGAYRRQDAGGIQTLLTYPRRDYPLKDFAWVMESAPEEVARFVAGKVVLVGVTAEAVKDELGTPLSDEHRGLDLHASFIDQIIAGALGENPITVRTIPDGLEVLTVVLAALCGVAIGFYLRNGFAVLGSSLLLVTLVLGCGWLCLMSYYWIPTVSPALAIPLGVAFASAASRAVDWRSLSQTRGVMLTLLGEDQVDLVWSRREQLLGSGKIEAKPSYATLMMTDLKGYTSVTEKLGRDGVLPWLNRHMDRMATVVVGHKGFVKEYIGDAIYAVFGLGDSEDSAREPARQAILCALAMREALIELNAEFENEDLPEAGMRVGINSGHVSVGTMGTLGAMEYAIIGDAVNIAARLEAYDKNLEADSICRIIVSDETLELGRQGQDGENAFGSEQTGQLELKGKAEKVGAHLISPPR